MSNEELVARIKAGERDKIPELWAQVKRLVWKQAVKWDYALNGSNGATAEDFAQAGFLGFLRAIDYHNPELGTAFSTTLYMCIKNPFKETAGVHTRTQFNDPLRDALSLDAPATTDEDSEPLVELIDDPNSEEYFKGVERRECHDALESALAMLTEEQRFVIKQRYYNELEPVDIAKIMGVDTQEIYKLERTGMRKLRAPEVSKKLRAFM